MIRTFRQESDKEFLVRHIISKHPDYPINYRVPEDELISQFANYKDELNKKTHDELVGLFREAWMYFSTKEMKK